MLKGEVMTNRLRSFRRTVSAVLCAALTATGCASASGVRISTPANSSKVADPAVLVEYAQKLPPGTTIRVQRASAPAVRGTLMKATSAAIFIQPRTRIPEPAIEIPTADILGLTPETGHGSNTITKAIVAGVAAGAGAALAVFLVLVSIYD